MTVIRPWLLILLAALAYGLAHLAWYATTPLGRVPVLDERENLTLAAQIVDGTLPHEPLYRAMGYPLLLAGLRTVGVPADQLPLTALFAGVLLHALGALLAGSIARRWFDDPRAGLIAGLLVALNPVLVHYATQRLDASFGLVLFLAGLAVLRLESDRPGRWACLGTSVCWTLAALTRPQYLTVWLILPLVWLWRQRTRSGLAIACTAMAIGGGLFVMQGWWQWSLCGQFRILPWQGAYNLWAANKPGTPGRYYRQTLDFSHAGVTDNPAKLESIILFQQETGRTDASIDTMNAYWRQRFRAQVIHHPFAWLGLLIRKIYALGNDWEQYNNKTYAFHKALSPWLRFNPIGWGLILVLGVAGAERLRTQAPVLARSAGLIATALAAGILLFYVSARFRLPLAALLCLCAGGALARPRFWQTFSPLHRGLLAATLLVAGGITFSSLDGVRDQRPFVQDHLLIARAAQSVADDDDAFAHAQAAIMLAPTQPDAAELLVTSWFNLELKAAVIPIDSPRLLSAAQQVVDHPQTFDPRTVVLAGVVLAGNGRSAEAIHAWRALDTPEALAALALAHAANAAEMRRVLALRPDHECPPLTMMALQWFKPEDFHAWMQAAHTESWGRALAQAQTRLFPGSPPLP